MDMETFSKISEYFNLAKIVKFSGWGDPLANPQALEMIKMAREKIARIEVFTDGKFLSEQASKELVNLGVEKITIRLYPPHNNLDDISENLQKLLKLRKAEPNVILDYKMTSQNIQDLPQFAEKVGDLKVPQLSLSNIDFLFTEELNNAKVFEGTISEDLRGDLIEQGKLKGKPEYEELVEQAEKIVKRKGVYFESKTLVPKEAIVCEYNPLKSIFVTWEGLVAPCPFLALKDKPNYYFSDQKYEQDPFIVGDLKTTELEQLLEINEYQEFRQLYDKRNQLFNQYMAETFEDEPSAELIYANYEKLDKQLLENKVPERCRKCYKTYSI